MKMNSSIRLLLVVLFSAVVMNAEAKRNYTADISTPEKRAALTARLWQHDASTDVSIWPLDRLPKGAKEKPYEFTTNELYQSNLVIAKMINPQLSYFPAPGKGVKPAVVIYPGGGYYVLGWNKEGTEIAEWLNSLGFSAFILLYRTDDRAGALWDAQRAMGIIRRDAEKYSIDPDRLGVIGFSAGANLAVRIATNWRQRAYPRVDDADDFSCRPNFMLPIYPWDLRLRKNPANPWMGSKKTLEMSSEYPVDAETPPSFTVQALDDFCEPETAMALDVALRKAGVESEAKFYAWGGHGYGLRQNGAPCDTWSFEAAGWLARFALPLKERKGE